MIPRVNLVTFDDPVIPPPGVIYSTNPRRAEGANGVPYFVKNTDPKVVFAEIVGCRLAREVGLPVADIAACVGDEGMYAGSARVRGVRHIDPWLAQPLKVVNFDVLFDVVVVDTWLANPDRNIESVLGRDAGGGNVALVFIDFERSVTLHPNPIILSGNVELRDLWPNGKLGTILRENKIDKPPQDIIGRIAAVTKERCSAIIDEAEAAIGSPVDWDDNCAHALASRATRIQKLAEEVWAI